jgi:hypothetical protein
MAKRQKSICDSYFGLSRETSSSTNDNIISVQSSEAKEATPSQVELARTLWKEQWASQFQRLDYSASEGIVFCKEKEGRLVYIKDGSKNFKINAFTDHSRSNEHHRLAWACTSGEKIIKKKI